MQKTPPPGCWIEEVFTFVENTIDNLPKALRVKFHVMDFCFSSICKFGGICKSRTLLQQLLACLNFALDSENLFAKNKKSDFY